MQDSEQSGQADTKKSLNTMIASGIGITLLLLIGGFLLSQQRSAIPNTSSSSGSQNVQGIESEIQNAQEPSEEVAEEDVTSTDENARIIDVEAGSFYYNPKEIRVKKGQTIKITLKAIDMMHDFNIDEFGVDGPIIKAGETTTIEFVADTLGEFEYYCSVGQHRSLGQVGTLLVEE